MLSTSGTIRNQISEAVTVISTHDFYKEWPTLLKELVDKMATNDLNQIHGILVTAHSIFNKYRDQYETEDLVDEVNYIIKGFAPTLLKYIVSFSEILKSNPPPQVYPCLQFLLEIFYTLNSINLPAYFEEKIKEFMSLFDFILKQSIPIDHIIIKCLIMDSLNVYMEKYSLGI